MFEMVILIHRVLCLSFMSFGEVSLCSVTLEIGNSITGSSCAIVEVFFGLLFFYPDWMVNQSAVLFTSLVTLFHNTGDMEHSKRPLLSRHLKAF